VTNLILLLNTQRYDSPGDRERAVTARSVAAWALGAIGPPAKVAASELLRCLEEDLSEEAATALVNIGVGDDPPVMKGLIELVCNRFPASQVAASLLLKGSTAASHIPALVEALRETTRTGKADAQSYILEILLHTGDPGRSAVEQYLAGAQAEEQASLTIAWLELDAQAKNRIRNLIDTSGAGAILKEGLDVVRWVQMPIPDANTPLGRRFWDTTDCRTQPFQGTSITVRCAASLLTLGIEGSEKAWSVFMRALTSREECVSTYAAVVLGKLDAAVARMAVPEIVAALRQCNDDSWNIPAICKRKSGDDFDPQRVLIDSLTVVGDGTTIQLLEPLTEAGSPPCAAKIAREIIAAIQARRAKLIG
jgi:hypothetical protein